MRSTFICSLLLCLVSVAVRPASAANVFSGDFPSGSTTIINAGPAIGNFSVTSGCVDLYGPGTFGLPVGTPGVDLDGSCSRLGTITSTSAISLSPDFLYTLTFDYSSNNNTTPGRVNRAEVILGSVLDATVTGQADFSKSFTQTFTVSTVSSLNLIFTELGRSDDEGVLVGGIKISSAPVSSVPEPSSFALVLGGIGTFVAVCRRLRSKGALGSSATNGANP